MNNALLWEMDEREKVLVGIDYDKETKEYRCVIERMVAKSRESDVAKSRERKHGKSRERMLELISANPTITYEQMAEALRLSVKAIEKHMKILRESGAVVRDESDYKGKWIVKTNQ